MQISEYLDYKKNRVSNVVIYTTITDEYDNLIQHKHISKDFDYVCFTNQQIVNKGVWEIRPLQKIDTDSVRIARYHKVFPDILFEEYNYSVWIDANIDVLSNKLEKRVLDLIDNKSLISMNKHFERSCIYQEAFACIYLGKENPNIIFEQINFYKSNSFPENQGLTETNIIFRNHNNQIIHKMMTQWWELIQLYSKRDQLSFMYVLFTNKIHCEIMFEQNSRELPDFKFYEHNSFIFSTLFINTGKGFRLKEMICEKLELLEYQFSVFFDVSNYKNITSLKFVPANNHLCKMKISFISLLLTDCSEKEISLSQIKYNGFIDSEGYINFLNFEPIVIFRISDSIKTIRIKGLLKILNKNQLSEVVFQSMQKTYTWKIGKFFLYLPECFLNFFKRED